MPLGIFELTNLEYLNLNQNNLSEIPESIISLKKLSVFTVADNKIGSLPKYFGALHSLTELHLEENLITHLPESIGQLKNLKILDISDNEIAQLPESLTELTQENIRLEINDNPIDIIQMSEKLGQFLEQKLDFRTVVWLNGGFVDAEDTCDETDSWMYEEYVSLEC